MKRVVKYIAWSIIALLFLVIVAGSLFTYKIKNGFPVSYETTRPEIEFPAGKKTVLVFSKATGFHHTESINAGIESFKRLAVKNDWFLFTTEKGGVFNPEQLAGFDAIVFNNCTGRLLNEEQQLALESYVKSGGKLIGIHGAGDNSHHWPWYEENLIGVQFSHHPIERQLQETTLYLNNVSDSLLTTDLPSEWEHTDEWYIFHENPGTKGFDVIYHLDGETIDPNGNLFFLVRDKNFGMGKFHPVAWYRAIGNGMTFYTSIGHDANAWKQEPFLKMIENAIGK